MGKKGKRFPKKGADVYKLMGATGNTNTLIPVKVHRENNDEEINFEEDEYDECGDSDDLSELDSEARGHQQLVLGEYGFSNDGYNYLQHFRELGGGQFIDNKGQLSKPKPATTFLPDGAKIYRKPTLDDDPTTEDVNIREQKHAQKTTHYIENTMYEVDPDFVDMLDGSRSDLELEFSPNDNDDFFQELLHPDDSFDEEGLENEHEHENLNNCTYTLDEHQAMLNEQFENMMNDYDNEHLGYGEAHGSIDPHPDSSDDILARMKVAPPLEKDKPSKESILRLVQTMEDQPPPHRIHRHKARSPSFPI